MLCGAPQTFTGASGRVTVNLRSRIPCPARLAHWPSSATSTVRSAYRRARLVVCGCVAIRGGDESGDWLDFYVPVGALGHAGLAYWDGRPFFRSDVMDEWLAAIGTETFQSASFSLGVIGFEVSGCTDASTLAGRLPQTRHIGYLLPQGSVLHYGSANT